MLWIQLLSWFRVSAQSLRKTLLRSQCVLSASVPVWPQKELGCWRCGVPLSTMKILIPNDLSLKISISKCRGFLTRCQQVIVTCGIVVNYLLLPYPLLAAFAALKSCTLSTQELMHMTPESTAPPVPEMQPCQLLQTECKPHNFLEKL